MIFFSGKKLVFVVALSSDNYWYQLPIWIVIWIQNINQTFDPRTNPNGSLAIPLEPWNIHDM